MKWRLHMINMITLPEILNVLHWKFVWIVASYDQTRIRKAIFTNLENMIHHSGYGDDHYCDMGQYDDHDDDDPESLNEM